MPDKLWFRPHQISIICRDIVIQQTCWHDLLANAQKPHINVDRMLRYNKASPDPYVSVPWTFNVRFHLYCPCYWLYALLGQFENHCSLSFPPLYIYLFELFLLATLKMLRKCPHCSRLDMPLTILNGTIYKSYCHMRSHGNDWHINLSSMLATIKSTIFCYYNAEVASDEEAEVSILLLTGRSSNVWAIAL